MIEEIRIVAGRLCGCPEGRNVSFGLRMPEAVVMLWVRCNTCGAEAVRPTDKVKFILEEQT